MIEIIDTKKLIQYLKKRPKILAQKHEDQYLITDTFVIVVLPVSVGEEVLLALSVKPEDHLALERQRGSFVKASGTGLNLEGFVTGPVDSKEYIDTGLMYAFEKDSARIYTEGSDFLFINARFAEIFEFPHTVHRRTKSDITDVYAETEYLGSVVGMHNFSLPPILEELINYRRYGLEGCK